LPEISDFENASQQARLPPKLDCCNRSRRHKLLLDDVRYTAE
jgi:hypothetical protein